MMAKSLLSFFSSFKWKGGLLLGTLLLLGFGLYKFFFSAPFAPPLGGVKTVEIITVRPQDIQQTVRLIGTVRPKQSTTLFAKSSGTFIPLLRSGQKVSKGTLMGRIENGDVEKNYLLCDSAEKIAHTQYDRESRLLQTSNSSKQSVESKKNAWIEAQKNLATSKSLVEKIRFYAPFDGVLGVFKAREGSQVQEGDPIVSFYDPSQVLIDFDIPAPLIHTIQDGQSLFIEGKEHFLTHFQAMVDEATHMCPAYVEAALEKAVVGTTIPVDLVLQQKKQTLVIPFEAVFLRDGKTFVYRVEKDKATLTPVQLGLREKDQVQVLSGLQEGHQVIFTGHYRLYPEAPVKVHNPPASEKSPEASL